MKQLFIGNTVVCQGLVLDGGDSERKQSLSHWSPLLRGEDKQYRMQQVAQQREGHQRPRPGKSLEKTLELKLKGRRQRKEHFKGHTGKGREMIENQTLESRRVPIVPLSFAVELPVVPG